jgi:hypothetical protein
VGYVYNVSRIYLDLFQITLTERFVRWVYYKLKFTYSGKFHKDGKKRGFAGSCGRQWRHLQLFRVQIPTLHHNR